jgi:hypothetical protein
MSEDQSSPPIPPPSSVPQVSALAGLSLRSLRHLGALRPGRDDAEAEAAIAALQQVPGDST